MQFTQFDRIAYVNRFSALSFFYNNTMVMRHNQHDTEVLPDHIPQTVINARALKLLRIYVNLLPLSINRMEQDGKVLLNSTFNCN